MRLAALAAAVLAIGSIALGCGGGGTDSSSGPSADTPPASKAEFIKKADVICAREGKKSETEFAAFLKDNKIPEGKEPTSAQFAEVGEEILIPILRQLADELSGLGVPAQDEDQINAYLDALDEVAVEVEEDPKIAKSPPALLANARKLIEDYGFKVCGQG